MNHTTIAVDLAKSVFELAVSDRLGLVHQRHRLTRAQFGRFFANRPSSIVLLEACGSSHHWGRQLHQLGHPVRLLPAHAVRLHVTRNKTDRADAQALLEAARDLQLRDDRSEPKPGVKGFDVMPPRCAANAPAALPSADESTPDESRAAANQA